MPTLTCQHGVRPKGDCVTCKKLARRRAYRKAHPRMCRRCGQTADALVYVYPTQRPPDETRWMTRRVPFCRDHFLASPYAKPGKPVPWGKQQRLPGPRSQYEPFGFTVQPYPTILGGETYW